MEWKQIVLDSIEYPYEINTVGEVRRITTKRPLKHWYTEDGYGIIDMCLEGKKKRCRVHRLMLITFTEPPANYEELAVNHIDGNKLNNTVENLEWCTWEDNLNHAYEKGLNKQSKPKPVVLWDYKTGELVGYYDCGTDAAKDLNLEARRLRRLLKGQGLSIKGYGIGYTEG